MNYGQINDSSKKPVLLEDIITSNYNPQPINPQQNQRNFKNLYIINIYRLQLSKSFKYRKWRN